MHGIFDIAKREYISILRNKGKKVRSSIPSDILLKKVKYLTKWDLIHLATLRGLVFDESDVDNIVQVLLKNVLGPKLKNEIYRETKKREYNRIINKVKKLRRLKNTSLTKIENISEEKLSKLVKLSNLPTKILKKLAQLRDVEVTGLKRS